MRKSGQDTGNSVTPAQPEPDAPPADGEPVEGDQVIELVGGRPFIYEQNDQNERRMAQIRGSR
jgi:hypothetical protein